MPYTGRMLRGILLDIDGTLVLSNDAHARSWCDAFAEAGYDVACKDVRRLIGMGADKLIPALFPQLNDQDGDGARIKRRRSEIFAERYASGLRPAPGARQLVAGLQAQGLVTVVASSAKRQELQMLLEAAGVADLLGDTEQSATTSDDADTSKPDPDIIEAALAKAGLPASGVLMIGDTPYDIEAAGRAGVQCVAVRCGGWDDAGLRGAIAIYDDPAAVLAHLTDLTGVSEGGTR